MFVVFSIVNQLLALLFGGWVFSYHWLWFVVPVFGVEPITAAHSAGLVLAVKALTQTFGIADVKAAENTDKLEMRVVASLSPWILWGSAGIGAWLWQAVAL